MTRQILLLAVIALTITSCSTAYKTGQTPDDVYYSPPRPEAEYVSVDDDKEEYRYDDEYYDDRYLRMKVRNRSRWSDLNDWYYYDKYSYTYNYHYGTWYNPYNSWQFYNNPYCHCYNNVIIMNPKSPQTHTTVVRPRSFNLGSYTNSNINNTNSSLGVKSSRPVNSRPGFNNSNQGRNQSGVGNTIRNILTPRNNDNNSSNSTSSPSRTYTPSNSSSNSSSNNSSNSSSSGSSGGGVSRPSRGGN